MLLADTNHNIIVILRVGQIYDLTIADDHAPTADKNSHQATLSIFRNRIKQHQQPPALVEILRNLFEFHAVDLVNGPGNDQEVAVHRHGVGTRQREQFSLHKILLE